MRLHAPSGTFDLVVGFGGASTIPHIVASPLAKLVTRRVVDGYAPWEALTRSFAGDIDALKSSPVIFMTPQSSPQTLLAISKMMGATAPPARVWGFPFVGCPTKACPGTLRFNTNGSNYDSAQFECLECRQRSPRYRAGKGKDVSFITRWDNAHPSVFSFDFPPTADQIAFWKLAEAPRAF